MKGTMEGRCKYCGQVIWVTAENSEDADAKAAESCDCGGYALERRLIDAKNVIAELCGEAAASKDKAVMLPNVIELLYAAVERINKEQVDKVTVSAGKSQITLSITSGGKIKVSRTDKEISTGEA